MGCSLLLAGCNREKMKKGEIATCNMITGDIADILLIDNAVKIYMNGSYSKAPFSFDLKVTINVKVTAVD